MYAGKRIRVLVAEDSALFRAAIAKGLEKDPQIEIIGVATNAYDARKKILALKPDVITLDVEMPGMRGGEFLQNLMPGHPVPVIVVSAVSGAVFEAMQAGAVDFVAKPAAGEDMQGFFRDLSSKIKIASVARLVGDILRNSAADPAQPSPKPLAEGFGEGMVVAIGASTGGTEATSQILKALPKGMPGILIVQHMPPEFTRIYAERLDRECQHLRVREAKDGMPICPGHAYVAPGDIQMRAARRGKQPYIKVSGTEKVSGHCPSVDVLFNSVADVQGPDAVGILLTGMGADGAKGLLRMKEKGAFTIGQDQKSSVVYGMPMEAMKLGAVLRQAPLDRIPGVLLEHLEKTAR